MKLRRLLLIAVVLLTGSCMRGQVYFVDMPPGVVVFCQQDPKAKDDIPKK